MNILLDKVSENREEWLKLRQNTLGSSEIAAAAGLSPWCSPFKLFLDKSGRGTDFDEDNDDMWLGRKMEPLIGEQFARKHNMTVRAADILVQHPVHTWATASPDFLIEGTLVSGQAEQVLEAKNVSYRQMHKWEDDNVPDEYHCQTIWQMGCLELGAGWLAAFLGGSGRSFVSHPLAYDGEVMDLLLTAGGQFMEHLRLDEPPPALPQDRKLLDSLPRFAKAIDLNVELVPVLQNYEQCSKELSELRRKVKEKDQEREAFRVQIEQALGDSENGVVDEWEVSCVTTEKSGYVVPDGYKTTFTVRKDGKRI